jgi:hypothetical protein
MTVLQIAGLMFVIIVGYVLLNLLLGTFSGVIDTIRDALSYRKYSKDNKRRELQ